MMNKGDLIAIIANPTSRAIDWLLGTDIHNCAGCKSMQSNLNQGMSLTDAAIARWFSNKKQQTEETMTTPYIITEQYIVEEADSPKDALSKHMSGGSLPLAMNVQMRPQATAVQKPSGTTTAPDKDKA